MENAVISPENVQAERLAPRIGIYGILTVLAVAALVGSETVFTAFAFVWAIAGLLEIPASAALAFEAVAVIAALAATAKMAALAWRAERALALAPRPAV